MVSGLLSGRAWRAMPQGGTELRGDFQEDSSVSRRCPVAGPLPVSARAPHATSGSIDRREGSLFSLLPFRVAMPPKRPLPSPPGHADQTDPAGTPYTRHLLRVMQARRRLCRSPSRGAAGVKNRRSPLRPKATRGIKNNSRAEGCRGARASGTRVVGPPGFEPGTSRV